MQRISIRPITLIRALETVDVSVREGKVDAEKLSRTLKTTTRRARDILLEVQRMNLLCSDGKTFLPSKIAVEFLNAFQAENWMKMHEILMGNYSFYRVFMLTVDSKFSIGSFSTDEIENALRENDQMNFNRTAIDVLCTWGERLGILQRNIYTRCLYKVKQNCAFDEEFPDNLQTIYNEHKITPRFGMKQDYVEISKIRESMCEKQMIKRETFDFLLKIVFKKSCGQVELCGAPITSVTKKSRFSVRGLTKVQNGAIQYLKNQRLNEAPGIEIGGKEYRFIAIFGKIGK